jgi:serine/threonine-protein kinase
MARHSLDAVPRLKIVRDAIPDDLEVVIERALEKVPADRYQTSGEFAKALTTASTGSISRVTAARRPTRSQLTWRRRMSVGISVGVIVLVAGAWLLFGRHGRGGSGSGVGRLAQNRVAVLYFTDESRDSSLRYLADGLTESCHATASRRSAGAMYRATRSRVHSRPAPSSREKSSRSAHGRA